MSFDTVRESRCKNCMKSHCIVLAFVALQERPVPVTTEDVQVSVTVSSNEYETGREMLRLFKQRDLNGPNRPAIRLNALLAPHT